MKRGKYNKQVTETNVVQMRDKHQFKNTPVTLCFEAEIKRIIDERGESAAEVTKRLAAMSGVSERQIYHYRNGITELQPNHIKIFCQQFGSSALAFAWFSTFNVEQEQLDEFDLSRFASQTVRNVLSAGDKFLSAFDDGKIDGFEMNELELASAQIQRDARRFVEVARDNYNRRRAA